MTITKRYTSKVPKDKHEAPFLVVHIPRNIMSQAPQKIMKAYQVVTISSSALEHAFAYKK